MSIFTLPTTHTRVIPPTLWSAARIYKRRVDNGFRQIRFHYTARDILLRDLGFSARQRKDVDLTPQGSTDPAPHEETMPAEKGGRLLRLPLSLLSIQSKIMLMLLVSSLASLVVIGAVEYVSCRNLLMPIAAERMTQLREAQKRAVEMLFADLTNSQVVYTH